MPETPHWYVVRSPANEADYVALFHAIREKGVDERFGSRRYRYWYPGDGFKYWTMTTDVRRSHIINRAKVDVSTVDTSPRASPMIDPDSGIAWGHDWSVFTVAERHEALIAEATEDEARKRRERRQDQRREEARQLRLIKAVQKAGLPVKRAVIGGVAVEFGQPETTPTLTPLEEIETPEQLRRLI